MRLLVDFHHHALAESLLRLFGDRYGVDVWFPYGMEWFDSGTWQFERQFHGDRVARQYLEGIWTGATELGDGQVSRLDPRHPGRRHYGVTWQEASSWKWDLVISTLPHNDEGFARFADITGARFGVQVGNHLQDSRWDLATFILASSTLPGLVEPATWAKPTTWQGTPTVVYHQEFDAHDAFHADTVPALTSREVASWVNCFPETSPYPAFREFARRTGADFDWKVYGAYGSAAPDELAAGDVSWVPDIGERMRQARIGFHMKSWSDGFGHVIHNWFAVGRPVVGVPRYYADKLAGPLFVEGVTSWDIERHDEADLIAIMRRLRDDDDFWLAACQASRRRFEEVVDFDEEARVIGGMLGL